jgi:hypothetical protein
VDVGAARLACNDHPFDLPGGQPAIKPVVRKNSLTVTLYCKAPLLVIRYGRCRVLRVGYSFTVLEDLCTWRAASRTPAGRHCAIKAAVRSFTDALQGARRLAHLIEDTNSGYLNISPRMFSPPPPMLLLLNARIQWSHP